MTASAHTARPFPFELVGRLAHLNGMDTLIARHIAARNGGLIELSGDGHDGLALTLLDALLSFSPAVEFGAPGPMISHLRSRLPAGVQTTGPRVLRLEGPGRLPRLVLTHDPAEREYWRCAGLNESGPVTVFLTCPVPDRRGNGVPLLRARLHGLQLCAGDGHAELVMRP